MYAGSANAPAVCIRSFPSREEDVFCLGVRPKGSVSDGVNLPPSIGKLQADL